MEALQAEKIVDRRVNNGLGSKVMVFAYAAGGTVIYFIALISYLQSKSEAVAKEPKWQVAVLFFLPVIAQIVGAAYHAEKKDDREYAHRYFYKFSMWVSFVCITCYCFFWVMYSFDYKAYDIFSFVALVIVGLLICLVIVIMCAFMQ